MSKHHVSLYQMVLQSVHLGGNELAGLKCQCRKLYANQVNESVSHMLQYMVTVYDLVLALLVTAHSTLPLAWPSSILHLISLSLECMLFHTSGCIDFLVILRDASHVGCSLACIFHGIRSHCLSEALVPAFLQFAKSVGLLLFES